MSNTSTILVIDDDALLVNSIAGRLTEEGYTVKTAQNGTDGITAAREHKPALIILDYQMPDMNGIDVLKKIRADETGKDIEVIIATNSYDNGIIYDALSLGVHDYILKADTSLDQIAELAEKYLPKTT